MQVLKNTALEALVLVLIAGAAALTGNAVRARGLDLTRDYFKAMPSPATTGGVRSDQLRPADAKKKVTPLPNPGVQEVTLEEVVHCFRDPEYAPGQADSRYLFLDARNDADYQEGHIPGALQVDHYYKDEYLPDLLPRIDSAEHVIIYCNGDDCEDSILVCMDLLDEGVPARKLMLFRDGWEGWVKAKCAVETEGD